MNENEQIDEHAAKLPDWRSKTVADIRKIIQDADPEMKEELKWMGSPVWSHDGIVCVAITCKDKVKLTFEHGAHLADPDRLFNNGLGKQWRTIDIHKDGRVDAKPLKTLIKAAVDLNRATVKTKNKPVGTRGIVKNKAEK